MRSELLVAALDFHDQKLYDVILQRALLEKNDRKILFPRISEALSQRFPENCTGLDWNTW